ncbi:MAG: hypothetical protein ACREN6_04095, partial [Gemmatimonadaceae bacterium]
MSRTPATPTDGDLLNAEILRWQGKFRRVFALLVGFGTIALKWAGVISGDSVVARSIGVHAALRDHGEHCLDEREVRDDDRRP